MDVAIVGSRYFTNYKKFKKALKKIIKKYKIKIGKIISGGCKGIDSLAERYAKEKNIHLKIYYPKWKKYGKVAGLKRNKKIVKHCDRVIAFPTKKSKGTYHTISLARKYKKKVYVKLLK